MEFKVKGKEKRCGEGAQEETLRAACMKVALGTGTLGSDKLRGKQRATSEWY